MGGGMSPARAELLYRHWERKFFLSRRSWSKWGLSQLAARRPGPLTRIVVVIRIAGDDISLSFCHCASCLGELPAQVYPSPLRHCCEESGLRVPIIDLIVEAQGFKVVLTRANKNF